MGCGAGVRSLEEADRDDSARSRAVRGNGQLADDSWEAWG